MEKPKYILFAGVNGSGKSTLYHLLPNMPDIPKDIPYINLDDRIRAVGDWRDISINMLVGREVILEIRSLFERHGSFIEETTLCGKSILKNIAFAAENGYSIDIYYVGLSSPELAKERVHNRMLHGGHGVSDEDIERRYYQSFENLNQIASLCDSITFYDNSVRFQPFGKYKNSILEFLVNEPYLPSWFTTYIHL